MIINAPALVPGAPATIVIYTDTCAAVITKVTRTSITLAHVETGEPRKGPGDNDTIWDGIVDQPIPGTEAVYRLRKDGRFHGPLGRVVLGRSYTRRDWTF
jgi:hypothetical protein